LEGHKIAEIKCGQEHNVILTTDGLLFSYGKNNFGSLGLGGRIFAPSPQRITKLENKKIVSVACGFHHSLALSNIGDVYSWGRGF
jgi:alpha-tubulin suppressor-like RCC1 family protein